MSLVSNNGNSLTKVSKSSSMRDDLFLDCGVLKYEEEDDELEEDEDCDDNDGVGDDGTELDDDCNCWRCNCNRCAFALAMYSFNTIGPLVLFREGWVWCGHGKRVPFQTLLPHSTEYSIHSESIGLVKFNCCFLLLLRINLLLELLHLEQGSFFFMTY